VKHQAPVKISETKEATKLLPTLSWCTRGFWPISYSFGLGRVGSDAITRDDEPKKGNGGAAELTLALAQAKSRPARPQAQVDLRREYV
jgi:hypothetical protein